MLGAERPYRTRSILGEFHAVILMNESTEYERKQFMIIKELKGSKVDGTLYCNNGKKKEQNNINMPERQENVNWRKLPKLLTS